MPPADDPDAPDTSLAKGDVRADWDDGPDAMRVNARSADADPELPLLGDNGADQDWPLRRRRPRR